MDKIIETLNAPKKGRCAVAEVVQVKCPQCGHQWVHLGGDPYNRESYIGCQACDNSAGTYSRWVVETLATLWDGEYAIGVLIGGVPEYIP